MTYGVLPQHLDCNDLAYGTKLIRKLDGKIALLSDYTLRWNPARRFAYGTVKRDPFGFGFAARNLDENENMIPIARVFCANDAELDVITSRHESRREIYARVVTVHNAEFECAHWVLVGIDIIHIARIARTPLKIVEDRTDFAYRIALGNAPPWLSASERSAFA